MMYILDVFLCVNYLLFPSKFRHYRAGPECKLYSRGHGGVIHAKHNKRQGMSKALGSSFTPNTPLSVADRSSKDVSRSPSAVPSQNLGPVSTFSSHAGPSTWQVPSGWAAISSAPGNRKSVKVKERMPEDDETIRQTAARYADFFLALADHSFV